MDLTHAEAREAIEFAADGALEAARLPELERHLAGCAECRAYAVDLQAFDARLNAALQLRWPVAPDGDLRPLLAGFQSQDRRNKMLVRLSTPVRALAWLVLVLAVAAAFLWAVRSVAPQPAAGGTIPAPTLAATQTPNGHSYEWHGTTLNLSLPLPKSPAQADVYLLHPDRHATLAQAQSLAQRFGINGEAYQTAGEVTGTTDYVITDGRQRLTVRSDHYYSYYADFSKAFMPGVSTATSAEAPATIDRFLKSHGFDFQYEIDTPEIWGGYYVRPLSPDGRPVQHEFFKAAGMLFSLDAAGQVLSLQADLVDFESVGKYGTRSAQQALQTLLDPNAAGGTIEGLHGGGSPITSWQRVFPHNQAITIYGRVASIRAVDVSKPPFVQINSYTARGNITGLDALEPNTYIEAQGQFITENGIEKFAVQSWKVSALFEDGLPGTLRRDNGQVTLSTADQGSFVLADVPPEVPMPFENAFVIGARSGQTFEWKSIDDRDTQNRGGGGGGGLGFYRLNLSGTPVPVPTPTVAAQPDQFTAGQRIEAVRGIVTVTIYNQPGGGQRAEYGFALNVADRPNAYMLLEGEGLQPLQSNNNRPVDIWGVIDRINEYGTPVVKVERYDVPFPDLKFQILRGTQKITDVNGQSVTLFTGEDGKTYVQLFVDGTPGNSLIGVEGDQVLLEALAIPGEAFGGDPAVRVFGGSLAVSPKNGQAMELPITADQPSVMDEPPVNPAPSTPPTATIEKIELVYYVSDPRSAVPDISAGPAYLQPAWRFYGHYSNGDEFEVLVQALKPELLLPELAPFIPPG